MYHFIFADKIKILIMNICLIGNNLTNLVLANILINRKIKVDLYLTSQKKKFLKIERWVFQKKILIF